MEKTYRGRGNITEENVKYQAISIIIILNVALVFFIYFFGTKEALIEGFYYDESEYNVIVEVKSFTHGNFEDYIGKAIVEFQLLGIPGEVEQNCKKAMSFFPFEHEAGELCSKLHRNKVPFSVKLNGFSIFKNATYKKHIKLITKFHYFHPIWFGSFAYYLSPREKQAKYSVYVEVPIQPLAKYQGYWIPLKVKYKMEFKVLGNNTLYIRMIFNFSKNVNLDEILAEKRVNELAYKGGHVLADKNSIVVKVDSPIEFLRLAKNSTIYCTKEKEAAFPINADSYFRLGSVTCYIRRFYAVRGETIYVYDSKYPSNCWGDGPYKLAYQWLLAPKGTSMVKYERNDVFDPCASDEIWCSP